MKRPKVKLAYAFIVLMVTGMVFTVLYPIGYTMMNGLKANAEIFIFPPRFFPSEYYWSNFVDAWNYFDIMLYFKNTLLIFAGNMLVTVFVLGFAAYALSKLHLPFKKLLILFFLSTLFIPPTTYIIPNFLNLKDLGLLNTYWAFWLPAGSNAFFLLLLKLFMDNLSDELFEAARIDGASELRSFFQIVFPLSLPIFATLGIFVFADVWKDWFWPSLILSTDSKYPLATAVYQHVIDVRRLNWNIRFAIITMVMVPPIIVFLLFQKFIIRGLQVGGIKG